LAWIATAAATAVGSGDLLGVIEIWMLKAVDCGVAFCAFVATFILVTEFVKDIKDKYGRKRNNNVGQNFKLAGGFCLVCGQPSHKRASLRNRLGNPSRTVLVTWVIFRIVHGFLVNVEKLLFYVAVKICGDPLPVFFGKFVIHKRVDMTTNRH
jgi:hypothetical protein